MTVASDSFRLPIGHHVAPPGNVWTREGGVVIGCLHLVITNETVGRFVGAPLHDLCPFVTGSCSVPVRCAGPSEQFGLLFESPTTLPSPIIPSCLEDRLEKVAQVFHTSAKSFQNIKSNAHDFSPSLTQLSKPEPPNCTTTRKPIAYIRLFRYQGGFFYISNRSG